MDQPNENLPDPQAGQSEEQRASIVWTRAAITQWDGPLPPPEAFEMYENTLPGTAARLLAMAESQHQHRINQEQAALELSGKALENAHSARVSESRRGYLGIALGFILVLIALASGVFLAAIGRNVVGLTFGLASLAGLAGVFVYGAQLRRAERRSNTENDVREQ